MARNRQVTRLLKILGLISNRSQGITAGELSGELDVTHRTIYRDFEALQEAGFPLVSSAGDESQSRWKFVDGYRCHVPIPLSITELMGLHFSRHLLKPLAGTVFADSVSSAMQKVEASLPEESLQFLKKVEFSFGAGFKGSVNYQRHRQLIDLVNRAVLDGETLTLGYFSHSSLKPTRRRVDPYSLYYYQGNLYVIGYCHLTKEVRTFAVERIRMAEKTGRHFAVPKDFSLDKYFKDSFGIFRAELTRVRIRFDKKVAPHVVSRVWHPSQQIERLPDKGIILRLDVAGTREIKTWVMGFADHAEVLDPKALRREIKRDLEKMASSYESPSSRAVAIA